MKRFLFIAFTLSALALSSPVLAQDPPADLEKAMEAKAEKPKDIVGVPNPAAMAEEAVAKGTDAAKDTTAPIKALAEDEKPEVKVPETPQEVVEEVSFLIRAAKSGQWSLFAGFLILVLIWVSNKMGLREKVGKKALPWISVGLGVLASIGVMLATGIPVDEAIIAGILAGLAATGGWELIMKHLFKEDPKPVPEKPTEA